MKANANRKLFQIALALLTILSMTLVACGGDDDNKDEKKSYTVGIMNMVEAGADAVAGFQEGLAELGYVEGENITYIYAGPSIVEETLAVNAQNMVDQKPDLILTVSRRDIEALRAVDEDILIIFLAAYDPVEEGYVEDLQHPGKNASGIRYEVPYDLTLNTVLQIDSTIKTVYVPFSSQSSPYIPEVVEELQAYLGEGSDVELIAGALDIADVMENGLTGVPEDVDHILMPPDSALGAIYPDFMGFAMERQIAISVPMTGAVMPGILVGYGTSLYYSGKHAAQMTDRVLKGTNDINEMPVENGDYYLTINLEIAQTLGLDVPDTVLHRAEWIMRPEETGDTDAAADLTGFCTATMTTQFGADTICITQACAALEDNAMATYSDATEVEGCPTEGILGTCTAENFDTYFYTAIHAMYEAGCVMQGGTWTAASE